MNWPLNVAGYPPISMALQYWTEVSIQADTSSPLGLCICTRYRQFKLCAGGHCEPYLEDPSSSLVLPYHVLSIYSLLDQMSLFQSNKTRTYRAICSSRSSSSSCMVSSAGPILSVMSLIVHNFRG